MTRKEAWVRFMAGAMADPTRNVGSSATAADKALAEFDARWPDKETEPPRDPRPAKFVGDDP